MKVKMSNFSPDDRRFFCGSEFQTFGVQKIGKVPMVLNGKKGKAAVLVDDAGLSVIWFGCDGGDDDMRQFTLKLDPHLALENIRQGASLKSFMTELDFLVRGFERII